MNNHQHDEHDPFELIRQADPAPRDSMPTAMSPLGRSIRAQVAEQMVAERPLNRRYLLVRVALVIALLMSVGAWAMTRIDHSDRLAMIVIRDTKVICYEEASLQSTGILVTEPSSLDASVCTPLWIDESLKIPSLGNAAAPPLVACVDTEGVLVVFPDSDQSDVCADLDLARHESSTAEQSIIDLNTRLNRLFNQTPCLELTDAKRQAAEILRATGLEDWTVVEATAATDERPCASYAIDANARTVVLVPVPDPG